MSQRPVIAYVCGYGRSGSTMFDALMGNHPQVFGGGELTNLFAHAADGGMCSCGEPLGTCDVWRPIWERIRETLGEVDAAALDRLTRSIEQVSLRGSSGEDKRRYFDLWTPILDALGSHSGRPIVLDSSKNVKISYRRPYLLREMGYELRFLHLVRDPRAVMYSVAKGLESGLAKGEVAHLPGGKYRSLYGWTSANLSAEILRRSFPSGSFLRVRYEDLMTDLSGQLDRIGEFLGIDMRPLAQQVAGTGTLDPGHGVSGNRMRRQGPIQVKYDQAWTKLVRPTDQLVWLPAWPLAARYGYRWGRSGIST